MSTLYIEEFSDLGSGQVGDGKGATPQAGRQPNVTSQTVNIPSDATVSTAFAGTTRFVRLNADATISYKFGSAPTATASSPRLPSGQTEYFAVQPTHKVSIITNT